MEKGKEIQLNAFWSGSVEDKHIDDFISVQQQVFNNKYNRLIFERKFLNNIYGKSLIVLAYHENKCVGARAFWRNDIGNYTAYQPCDTAVLEEYRGLRLFSKMTNVALERIEKDALIYNFPNNNSLPGYLKMGWKISKRMRYKLFNIFTDTEQIERIESNYMDWLTEGREKRTNNCIRFAKIKGVYYLVKELKYNLYLILGIIDEVYTMKLMEVKAPIYFIASSKGYIGRGLIIVTKNLNNTLNIPVNKIDIIFH